MRGYCAVVEDTSLLYRCIGSLDVLHPITDSQCVLLARYSERYQNSACPSPLQKTDVVLSVLPDKIMGVLARSNVRTQKKDSCTSAPFDARVLTAYTATRHMHFRVLPPARQPQQQMKNFWDVDVPAKSTGYLLSFVLTMAFVWHDLCEEFVLQGRKANII